MEVCEIRTNKRKFVEVDGCDSDGFSNQQKCFVNQVCKFINFFEIFSIIHIL